jgi:hypothetical protein
MPGLTSYTRPTSSFEPEGGRATGLKPGLLNPMELRGGPVASGPVGGTGMPITPAGMLNRGQGEGEKQEVQQARIVIAGAGHQER